jgi:hypothetical protein
MYSDKMTKAIKDNKAQVKQGNMVLRIPGKYREGIKELMAPNRGCNLQQALCLKACCSGPCSECLLHKEYHEEFEQWSKDKLVKGGLNEHKKGH